MELYDYAKAMLEGRVRGAQYAPPKLKRAACRALPQELQTEAGGKGKALPPPRCMREQGGRR